jgi:ankyrin repeat protein
MRHVRSGIFRALLFIIGVALLAAAVFRLTAASSPPKSTEPRPVVSPNAILFVSIGPLDPNGRKRPRWDIWTMQPDGSGRKPLTQDAVLEVDPVWSPDGQQIAFVAQADPRHRRADLWRMNRDGTGRQQLTRHPEGTLAVSPVWSPDGQDLAFARLPWEGTDEPTQVWVVDRNGRGGRKIGAGLPMGWSATRGILVVGPDGGLWSLSPHGGKPTLIDASADEGAWAPDGRRLASLVYRGGSSHQGLQIWMLAVAADPASSPTFITRFSEGPVYGPRWSGDGKRLLYTEIGEQFWDYVQEAAIFSIDIGGGSKRRLSPKGVMDWFGGGRSGLYLLRRLAPLWRKQDPLASDYFYALNHHEHAKAKRLVARGMDPNARGMFDIPALTNAVVSGDVDLVRALLKRGANVNARGPDYGSSHHSALYAAISQGKVALTRILLDAGARPDPPTYEGAGESANPIILKLLRTRFGKLGPTTLVGAADRGHIGLLRELLREGIDPNTRGVHGDTVLAMVANEPGLDFIETEGTKRLEALRALLDHGANVNGRSAAGRTALMEAAKWGNLEMVRLLVGRGADVNSTDRFGSTALMEAAGEGQLETVRYLLSQGARLDALDHVGDSILTRAVYGYASDYGDGDTRLIRLLIEPNSQLKWVRAIIGSRLNVNHRSRDGFTPLMASAQVVNGDDKAMRLLLEWGADPHARDIEGKTALDWANPFMRSAIAPLLKKPSSARPPQRGGRAATP